MDTEASSEDCRREMEGSAKYLELLHIAEDHFQQSVDVPESSVEVSPGVEILTLLQTPSLDLKELGRKAACLPPEDGHLMNPMLPLTWIPLQKALDRILGADSEELDSDDLDEEEEFDFSEGDDEDLDAGNPRQDQKVTPGELVGSLKSYMNEMDRELAQTNVGKSFTSQKRGAGSVEAAPAESAGPGSGAEDAELAPVDVDMNLVANLLESSRAQAGLAGPSWNILQSMG